VIEILYNKNKHTKTKLNSDMELEKNTIIKDDENICAYCQHPIIFQEAPPNYPNRLKCKFALCDNCKFLTIKSTIDKI